MTEGAKALRNLEERIEKLERAAVEIAEATREAHAAIKQLRKAEREVRDLLSTDARELVNEAIAERVEAGLASLAETTERARQRAVDRIIDEFDQLADLLLRSADGHHLVEDAVAAREHRKRQLEIIRNEVKGS